MVITKVCHRTLRVMILVLFICFLWLTSAHCANVSSSEPRSSSFDYNYRQALLLRSGFGSIVWSFIDSVDLKSFELSSECIQSLQNVNYSIGLGQEWPLKLIESSARAPMELTGSSYLDAGNYDQCLELSWSKMDINTNQSDVGQHCLVTVNPIEQPGLNYDPFTRNKIILPEAGFAIKLGFCFPASCSPNDVHTLVQKSLESYSWKVLQVDSCQKKQPFLEKFNKSSTATKISSIILASFVLLSLFCSLVAALGPGTQISWIDCYSIQTNIRATFSPIVPSNRIRRVFILEILMHLGVCTFHAFVWPILIGGASIYGSYHPMMRQRGQSWIDVILSCDILLECILIIPGARIVLQNWPRTDRDTPISYYLTTIVKRTISMSLLMALVVNLEMVTPLLADGPFIQIASRRAEVCSSTWYSNLIFMQNTYPGLMEMCAPQTWSIAVEMKLSLFLFALIYVYKCKPKVGFLLNIGLMSVSLLYLSTIFYTLKIEPHASARGFTLLDMKNLQIWMADIYLPTLNHLWSFMIPVLSLYVISKGFKLNTTKGIDCLKWIVILTSIFAILLLLPTFWRPFVNFMTPTNVAIYSIFFRILIVLFFLLFIPFLAGEVYLKHTNQNQLPTQIDSTNTKNQRSAYLHQSSKLDKLILTIVIILRSTYFVHNAVFVWYYGSQKWPILSTFEWAGHMLSTIVFAILTGLAFQLIILGPFVSLIVAQISTRNLSKAKPAQTENISLTEERN